MAEKKTAKKPEKTAAAIAAENARKAASDARAKWKASEKDADKTAYDKAKKYADDLTAKENRERFVRVGNGRYVKAVTAIRQLDALANRKTYTFDGPELDKIVTGLTGELDEVRKIYNRAKTGEAKAATADVALPLG